MYPIIFWGDLFRSLRESNCMLQKELALVLHVSRQTYSNLETGRARPSPEQLAILSYIYDVDLMEYVRHCLPKEYLDEQEAFRHYKEKKKNLEMEIETIQESKPKKKRTARTRPTVINNYSGAEAMKFLTDSRAEMVAEDRIPYGHKPSETPKRTGTRKDRAARDPGPQDSFDPTAGSHPPQKSADASDTA